MISKFEANLSPGLRELGFSFKVPDAGPGWKAFDFTLALPWNGILRYIAIEGKTARGNRFNFGEKWEDHQRRALQTLAEQDAWSAWVALHYPHVKGFRAILLPWVEYLRTECQFEKSIPHDVWQPGYAMVWEHGPVRKATYWRIPEDHPLRRL